MVYVYFRGYGPYIVFYTTSDQTYETPTSISRRPLTQEKVFQMMSLLPYVAFDK